MAAPRAVSVVWFVALLFITASFCLTLVQLSKGLHDQLLAVKEELYQARSQLVEVGVEKETLLEQTRNERMRVGKLRDKSSVLAAELLSQGQTLRGLRYEVLFNKEGLSQVVRNCTESSKLMEKQFNVTMRYLMDSVINNREYHALLDKNLRDRVKLERSVELLQNKVFNLTQQLTMAKSSLYKASKSLRQSKSDVEVLKDRLLKSNDALKKTQVALTNAQDALPPAQPDAQEEGS
mmetsp:Transcript_22734/g.44618  ORF Transcript_22734/g.44618 Transcript_22734/m.44618 type:complete len:236 (+) Transcript_22734:300-1007(+)|eukprot:CAMPEP_0171487036 /NCGR_PEP_ID=MMETSP0958-20121227/1419_1 /TAXON_ID=87120 /ORGANISM="Aurantiochytrium limacinum, Strain ATCCMYA-1381" /LENGTH=235 /DNA_ID=CAMNT_0012019975 /DNA_START=356 /DNA_END=1066 /DNA_ORIENTATION=-